MPMININQSIQNNQNTDHESLEIAQIYKLHLQNTKFKRLWLSNREDEIAYLIVTIFFKYFSICKYNYVHAISLQT